MNETVNTVLMAFLFVLRCLIPLAILFGISYLLRRMELIIEPPAQPKVESKSESKLESDAAPTQIKPVKSKKDASAKKQVKKDAPAKKQVKKDAPAKKQAAARTPSPKKKTSGKKKKPATPKRKKGVIA